MNNNRSLNKNFNKITHIRTVEELLLITIPGLWMLIMNPRYMRWNYGPLCVIGSILICCVYAFVGKHRKHNKMPWIALYAGMLLWSMFIFGGWVLGDRGTLAMLSAIAGIIPVNLRVIYWIILSLCMIYFIRQTLALKSKKLWIYLALHTSLLAMTIWILDSGNLGGQCTGIFSLLTSFPCKFVEVLKPGGLLAMAIVLLLLPTTIAFQYKESIGVTSVIIVSAIVPAWFELFFFPLQTLGQNLIRAFQENTIRQDFLESIIDNGAYIVIFAFMICLPLLLKLLTSERLKVICVVAISSFALGFTLMFYYYGMKNMGFLEISAIDYIAFVLSLSHVMLSIMFVIIWGGKTEVLSN